MSSPWVYDYATGKYVWWHATRRCWVDKDDRTAREPQTTPTVSSNVAGSSSRPLGTAPKPIGNTNQPGNTNRKQTQDATSAMKSLAIGSPPTYDTMTAKNKLPGNVPQPEVSYSNPLSNPTQGQKLTYKDSSTAAAIKPAIHGTSARNKAPYNATISDPSSGLKTRWEVSETTQYNDPINANSNRSLNIKRIREVESRVDKPTSTQSNEFRTYRVIEVLLVPPQEPDSNVSRITPTGAGDVRLRRFVIVREIPDRRCVEALAIKTYNFQGVAAPHVIKSHHSIIYTGKQVPRPTPGEHPRRNSQGVFENPMQASAIRVEPFNRGKALDPMARLDYADRYEFDWGVSNIRLFGKVHEDSQAALFVQFNSVWTTIRMSAQGVITANQPSAVASGGLTIPPESGRTERASSTRADYGSNPVPTAESSMSGPTASDLAAAQKLYQQFAAANSGPCREEEFLTILRYLQAYARREHLPVPSIDLPAPELTNLARNAVARAQYIQRIRDRWRVAPSETRESDDEDEDDDDDDDDDEEEDDE